jgi:hypothetical protein
MDPEAQDSYGKVSRTSTGSNAKLVMPGSVRNVRAGEEFMTAPIGTFDRMMASSGGTSGGELTIRDKRPIQIVMPNGKVLAEAAMPYVTARFDKKLAPWNKTAHG